MLCRPAARMALRREARSSGNSRLASRPASKIFPGGTKDPSSATPRSSASWAKTSLVSSARTMGWKWLVRRSARSISTSQSPCASPRN